MVRSRPALRGRISGLKRCIVTPEVAKHRVFVWMDTDVVPDHKLHVIAREDDYFSGSCNHDHMKFGLWLRALGWGWAMTPRYNSDTTFETFPFPWPPGHEPKDSPLVEAIATAARELVEKRDAWLNPPGATPAELKKRTLTNLYNVRPSWLAEAHRKLDEGVFAAYGWPGSLSDDDILARLLALNVQRANSQPEAAIASVECAPHG